MDLASSTRGIPLLLNSRRFTILETPIVSVCHWPSRGSLCVCHSLCGSAPKRPRCLHLGNKNVARERVFRIDCGNCGDFSLCAAQPALRFKRSCSLRARVAACAGNPARPHVQKTVRESKSTAPIARNFRCARPSFALRSQSFCSMCVLLRVLATLREPSVV